MVWEDAVNEIENGIAALQNGCSNVEFQVGYLMGVSYAAWKAGVISFEQHNDFQCKIIAVHNNLIDFKLKGSAHV